METVEYVEPIVEEVEETVVEEVKVEPKKVETKKEEVKKETKVIKERAPKTDYVSRFEKFAEASTPTQEEPKRSYRKKSSQDNEERRVRIIIKDIVYEVKPEYTEEELQEIEAIEAEENNWYDEEIDYDEYESYYEEEM